jgi:hypothetical protein
MKKNFYFFLLICSLLAGETFAQARYWVQFTDKNGTPYTLGNPSAYLSSRALARRTNFGISIDSTDLPVNPSYIAGVAATGATVYSHSKWLNGVVIVTNNSSVLAAVQALPYVASVSGVGARHSGPSHEKFSEETFSPSPANTQRSGGVYSSSLNYGASYNQINMLGGVCVHNAGFRGAGMQIAIIDAGFYHADQLPVFDTLFLNGRILGTWDFVMNEASVYEDNTHGSMVLSCMGGNLPGQLVGTAPDASYWLLRSEEAATEYLVEEYFWAAAAEYADSVGADVINSSLGYTEFDDPSENHVYADMDGVTTPCAKAANMAARKGIAVVVSAGNSGQSSWFYIGTPADADSALAIAATDASGIVTGFSSRGFAPDGGIKPNLGAQGGNSVVCDPFGTGTQTGNGTSFASPILCGMVACLLQAHPTLPPMQLYQVIEMSASQYANPDSLLGYGIPDFCAANLYLSGNSNLTSGEDALMHVGPNPFSQQLQFTFYSKSDQQIRVLLYDAQGGKLVDEYVNATHESENHYTLAELAGVSEGVYFLEVQSEEGRFISKVVKGE